MKKLFLISLLCFCCGVFAQNQTVSYSFAPHTQTEAYDGFSAVFIENCSYIGEEGTPDLPIFGATILLEPGHEIAAVNIIRVEYYPAVENIMIQPASAVFPISKGAPENYKPQPKTDIYATNKNYPEKIVRDELTSFYRGHALGSFLISPVIYNPVEKRAEFIKNITVEIVSQPTEKAQTALRFLRSDKTTVKNVERKADVNDQTLVSSYKNMSKRDDDANYDILVIAPQEFIGDEIDAYIAHKQNWGYKVLVKTLEEIKTNYSGSDDATKMRNCVIDIYEDEGISYLMLFGDAHSNSSSSHNKLPFRKMYGNVNDGGEVDNLPSDMYFACLDGTWESGDGTWGKPSGSTDYEHEISVGRLCADNKEEIGVFVEKLIKYQDNPVAGDIKKMMIVGEALDQNTFGCTYKEEIVSGGNFWGYTATGIPSDYEITRLCDNSYWGDSWYASDLYNNFNNNGVHFVNHLGHSDTNFNMKLYTSNVTNANFTNDGVSHGLAVHYSQGCYNGSFDTNSDCINEAFIKLNGGFVATIGNSRYGWYSQGSTNGGSQKFDRSFFHGIYGAGIYQIGDANSYSKDVHKALLQGSNISNVYRWCAYELNLMGDPSMEIWTDTPTEFNLEMVNFIQETNGFSICTNEPYSRAAIFDGNEFLGRIICDAEGNGAIAFDEPVDFNALTVSITAHNKIRYETGIEFTIAPPVQELVATVDGIIVTLQWVEPAPTKEKELEAYWIYRDGTKIAMIGADTNEFIDNSPLEEYTAYTYCVRARYEGISSPEICKTITTDYSCSEISNIRNTVKGKDISIFWDAPPSVTPAIYEIYRDEELVGETIYSPYKETAPREYTVYDYCVVAKYEKCDSDPICIKLRTELVCGIIENLRLKENEDNVTVTWRMSSSNELSHYIVSKNGEVVAETTEMTYIDEGKVNGTYEYCVTAVFDNCESDPLCETITIEIVDIDEAAEEAYSIYPNPSNNQITVAGKNINRIVIFDLAGRVISDMTANHSDQVVVPVSLFDNGTYLMQIHANGKKTIKTFSVIR